MEECEEYFKNRIISSKGKTYNHVECNFPILGKEQIEFALSALKLPFTSKTVSSFPGRYSPVNWHNGNFSDLNDFNTKKDNKVISRLSSFKYNSRIEENVEKCVLLGNAHSEKNSLSNCIKSLESTNGTGDKEVSSDPFDWMSNKSSDNCFVNNSLPRSNDQKFDKLVEIDVSSTSSDSVQTSSHSSLSPISGYRSSLQEAFRKIKFGCDEPFPKQKESKKKKKFRTPVWNDSDLLAINGICKKLSLLNCQVDGAPEVDKIDGIDFYSFFSLDDLQSHFQMSNIEPHSNVSESHSNSQPIDQVVPTPCDLPCNTPKSVTPSEKPHSAMKKHMSKTKKIIKSPLLCPSDSDSSDDDAPPTSSASIISVKRKYSIATHCSSKAESIPTKLVKACVVQDEEPVNSVFESPKLEHFLQDCSLKVSFLVHQSEAYYAIYERSTYPTTIFPNPNSVDSSNSNFPLLTKADVERALTALVKKSTSNLSLSRRHNISDSIRLLLNKMMLKSDSRLPYTSPSGAKSRSGKIASDNLLKLNRLSVDSCSSDFGGGMLETVNWDRTLCLELKCTSARKLCYSRTLPSLDTHEILDLCTNDDSSQVRNKVIVNKIVDLNHKFSGKTFSIDFGTNVSYCVYDAIVELDKIIKRFRCDSKWTKKLTTLGGMLVFPCHKPSLRNVRSDAELMTTTQLLYQLFLNNLHSGKPISILKTYLMSMKEGSYCVLFLSDVVRLLISNNGYFCGCDVVSRRLVLALVSNGQESRPILVGNLSRLLGIPSNSTSCVLIFKKTKRYLVLNSFINSNTNLKKLFDGKIPETVLPLPTETVKSLAQYSPCVESGLWQSFDINHLDNDVCISIPSHELLLPRALCINMISELYENVEVCSDVTEMVYYSLAPDSRKEDVISVFTTLHPKLNNKLLIKIVGGYAPESLTPDTFQRLEVKVDPKWDCECGITVRDLPARDVSETEVLENEENCQFLVDTSICGCVLSSYFGPVGSRSWNENLTQSVCTGYPVCSLFAVFLYNYGVPGILDQSWFWLPLSNISVNELLVLPGLPCGLSCRLISALVNASSIYETLIHFALDSSDHGMENVLIHLNLIVTASVADIVFITYSAEESRVKCPDAIFIPESDHQYCKKQILQKSNRKLSCVSSSHSVSRPDSPDSSTADNLSLSLPKRDLFYPFDNIVGTNDNNDILRTKKCPKVLMRKDSSESSVVGKIMLYSVRNQMYRIQRLSSNLVVVLNTCVDCEAEDYFPHCKVFSSYNAALYWMKHRRRQEIRTKSAAKRKRRPQIIETTIY